MAFSFQYQKNNFSWDIGYNFWGKSCENICIGKQCTLPAGCWALKGDNRVYGFVNNDPYYGFGVPVALAATDSNASIHQGSNLRNGVDYTPIIPQAPNNLYADSSIAATATANNGAVVNGIVTLYIDQTDTDGYTTNQIYSSSSPVLIQECNFNTQGTRGISNKVFTHLNWGWNDRDDTDWTPYFGFGAEVEFGNISKNCPAPQSGNSTCNTGCDTSCCTSCAVSQWGLWLKAGASYN
jgi:hypothetical protein